jgi:putative NADH-flavin reductase
MKLTVIGATGRTGSHVLTEGARRGHELTAFTRRPALLTDRSSLARVVEGDGTDPEAVKSAVAGADAVIAIVKAPSRNGPHQTAAVAQVIVAAMSEAGVRRLVMTSAYPVVATRPLIPMTLLRLVFKAGYQDMIKMEQVLAASDLDWIVARLYGLVDKPARGGVSMRRDLFEKPTTLSRADAAAALLNLVEDRAFARTALNIAGA